MNVTAPERPRAARLLRRAAARAMLVVAVMGVALLGAEGISRAMDGYRLGSLRLEPRLDRVRASNVDRGPGSHKWRGGADAWPYVAELPAATGVDKQWFLTQPPDRPLGTPDAELDARARRYPRASLEAGYEWNRNAVVRAVCRGYDGYEQTFNQFDDLYVFDPIDGSVFPTFRFLRHASYPSGLQTNAFGWRGPDIPLNKPLHTIRIVLVGASTTVSPHAEPYSYPELVGLWLARWAQARHPGISIETINAGREAVNSRSIQAIVRQELIPIEPDLVVYYEGANQFWPANFIWTPLPRMTRAGVKADTFVATYSAVGRRVESVLKLMTVPGSEPRKPGVSVDWPSDLDEHDPNLADPRLPLELPTILADLGTIRRALDVEASSLVMTSFEWLVYPGMLLDPRRDAMLFDYLNRKYWPFTYAHMRRLLDFQNRVFRKYAAAHALGFIDVAGALPRDPRLFDDAIHMTRAGIHLHAWITFNGLVPMIERRLASGEWPRPVRNTLSTHPAFGERRLVRVADLRAACGSGG